MENKRLFDDWCPYGFAYNQSKYPYLATEGYIPVKINGKCGYYDTQGNEIIPCGTFEEVRPVHNGLAWVKQDGRWGVIKLKNIETETNTSNNTFPDIQDYEGIYYPTNSDFNLQMEIKSQSKSLVDIEILFTNSTGTRVSQNIFSGSIDNNIIMFETDDGYAKNSFTLEFNKGKIYLTGKCIDCYSDLWGIPEMDNIEMQYKKAILFTGTVNTEKDPLNVRKSPSTEAKIIGKIDKGSTVTIYSENGDWYEIEYNGGVGYVSKKYIRNKDNNSDEQTSSISDSEILKAVNKYLKENQSKLGVWLSDGDPYCPAEHMRSNNTKWSCPINLNWDSYSANEIAGAYPHFAYVDKKSLKCTITANYETVVEFDLMDYTLTGNSPWTSEQIINSINAYLKENWCGENQYYCFESELMEHDEKYWSVCIRWDGSNSANVMTGNDCRINKETGDVEISFMGEPYEWFNIKDYK